MLAIIQQQRHLPILALLFTVALSTTFMALNKRTHNETEHPILYAVFCLQVTSVYCLYMLISRIAVLALHCIEHRNQSALSSYERVMEQHIEWGEEVEEEDDTQSRPLTAAAVAQSSSNNNPVSILFARGIHREALISSMYLGGSGCFLALPALSFWSISQTCAFLFSLTTIAFFSEHTKLVEFAPNQDKAKVLRELRHLRWALYAITIIFIVCLFCKDNRDALDLTIAQFYAATNSTTITSLPATRLYDGGSIIMLVLALVSPLLLRLSLPHAVIRTTSLMSPSQVLEAALPVSCLHAVLVLGWYGGNQPPIGLDLQTKWLPVFIPMLILCPFCQVVILAFILRGFRHRQTLPTVIILAFTTFIIQEIFGQSKMKAGMDWSLLSIAVLLLITAAALIITKHFATAPPENAGTETVILLNEITATTRMPTDNDEVEAPLPNANRLLRPMNEDIDDPCP